jgi:hypothetical protein
MGEAYGYGILRLWAVKLEVKSNFEDRSWRTRVDDGGGEERNLAEGKNAKVLYMCI